MANRLAAEGFVALASDLYGGTATHDAGEAARLMQGLPVDQAARDLGGAVDYLLDHDAERQTGQRPDFRFYPAGHAFFNDENLIGTYDPE